MPGRTYLYKTLHQINYNYKKLRYSNRDRNSEKFKNER